MHLIFYFDFALQAMNFVNDLTLSNLHSTVYLTIRNDIGITGHAVRYFQLLITLRIKTDENVIVIVKV